MLRIEGFDWDAGNERKNDKHGIPRKEAEEVFVNAPLLISIDDKHSMNEPRFKAYGRTNSGKLLTVIFTVRDEGRLIRVISARCMHHKERKNYGKKT